MNQTGMNQQLNQIDQIEDPLLKHLLCNKLHKNTIVLRQRAIDNPNNNKLNNYQINQSQFEFPISKLKYDTIAQLQEEYDKYQDELKKKQYSVNFDQVDIIENDNNSSTDDENQLRERLLFSDRSKKGESKSTSVDKELEVQDNLQQELISDMTKLVTSLKEGAIAFQTALDEDEKILGAAEIGIQVASRGIKNVSHKLKQYDSQKLSWLFYISATLGMLIGLIVTFVIIKLFPAL